MSDINVYIVFLYMSIYVHEMHEKTEAQTNLIFSGQRRVEHEELWRSGEKAQKLKSTKEIFNSLVTWEMHIRTTLRFHLIPVRKTKINKTNISCW